MASQPVGAAAHCPRPVVLHVASRRGQAPAEHRQQWSPASVYDAGDNLVKIVNEGDQPHFVDFNTVPDGTTNDQIAAAIGGEMTGTPGPDAVNVDEVVFVTSSGDQSAGTTTWTSIELEAGTYAGMCWFPDRETGMPHAMMDMHTVFEVD